MPYRKSGPPLTKTQLRQKEIYKANRKRAPRAESRMRKYHERKRRQALLGLCLILVIGLIGGMAWLMYRGTFVLSF
jgi:hypothetical protein